MDELDVLHKFEHKVQLVTPMKTALLVLLIALVIPNAFGLVGGGHTLTVDVSKSKDGKSLFDVVNLKQCDNAAEAAKWIYDLFQAGIDRKPAEEERQYSNSATLHFTEDYSPADIAKICAVFEANQVYILSATREKDGRRIKVDSDPDSAAFLEAMLESDEFTPEAREAIKAMIAKTKKAEHPAPSDGDKLSN